MRPRVQRASGIPCALFIFEGEQYLQTSGGPRRETAKVCSLIRRNVCGAEPPAERWSAVLPRRSEPGFEIGETRTNIYLD
jgi:hypothetical protein